MTQQPSEPPGIAVIQRELLAIVRIVGNDVYSSGETELAAPQLTAMWQTLQQIAADLDLLATILPPPTRTGELPPERLLVQVYRSKVQAAPRTLRTNGNLESIMPRDTILSLAALGIAACAAF